MEYYKIRTRADNQMWCETKLYRKREDNKLEFYLTSRWVESTHRTIESVMHVSRFLKPELIECTQEEILKEITMKELEK